MAANALVFAARGSADAALLEPMFGHADPVAFVMNLLFLWLFGPNVEDQLGRARYLSLYVACAVLLQLPVRAGFDGAAALGASGAVSGVIGGYFALFPRSRILMFFPLPPTLHELPVTFFLMAWLLLQGVSQLTAQGAHADLAAVLLSIAGATATGAALCLALRRRERARVEWWGA
jgi:membrane associated rhomboid family serine protease